MKPFSRLLDRPGARIGTWSQFANPETIDILGVGARGRTGVVLADLQLDGHL